MARLEPVKPYRKWGITKAQYEAYVKKSPIWAQKRKEARERAGYRCEDCGDGGQLLEAHHLTYERFGGDELPGDLRVVCQKCHNARHRLKWKGKGPPQKHRIREKRPKDYKMTAAEYELWLEQNGRFLEAMDKKGAPPSNEHRIAANNAARTRRGW